MKSLLNRTDRKRERRCNITNAFAFCIIGNDDIAIIAFDERQLSPKQSHLLCMYYFIKDVFAFILNLIIADIGTGYRLVSIMLYSCPYGITISRDLPYPRRKTRWNRPSVQSRYNLKRDILRQIFSFNIVSCLFQAKIKQLFHIIFSKFIDKLIAHSVRFLHFSRLLSLI